MKLGQAKENKPLQPKKKKIKVSGAAGGFKGEKKSFCRGKKSPVNGWGQSGKEKPRGDKKKGGKTPLLGQLNGIKRQGKTVRKESARRKRKMQM